MTFGRVFLVIFAFALLEVLVLAAAADVIGWPITILVILATAVIGSWLFRAQGLQTWTRLNQRLQAGEMPAKEMVEGMMLLIGGALLITPGFISDAVGFALLLPVSRKYLAAALIRRGSLQAFSAGRGSVFFYQNGSFSGGPGGSPFRQGEDRDGVVIDGEAREESEPASRLHRDDDPRP